MRLFLASTEELTDLRDAVLRVVHRFNVTLKDQPGGDSIELIDWSSHVAEKMGADRAPILPLESGDIFLGIAWLRFGTPRAADPESEASEIHLGTEEDFELAYRSCASSANVVSLFYRSMRSPERLSDISADQLGRIERFYARFQDGKSPGLYSEFQTVEQLEERLDNDLTQVFESRAARPAVAETATRPGSLENRTPDHAPELAQPEFTKKMQADKAYEVSFLAIELVNFGEMARQNSDQREAVETLQQSFKRLLIETGAGYGGEIFAWNADEARGILMFWSKRSYDHAIITGLKVIHSLPVFNLDPQQNPLGQHLEIRTAAHDAVIVFKMPLETISSVDLEFLRALCGQTSAGELCVTKRLLERADERLRARFSSKGRFESEPIFACRLPSTQQHALRSNLEEVVRKVKTHAASIKSHLVQPTSQIEALTIEAVSANVEETYALLDRGCQLVGQLDNSWPKKFFADLAGLVHVLIREEAELWNVLRQAHVQHREAPDIATRLEVLVQAASSQRSRPAVTLGQAEQGLRARASDEVAAEQPRDVDEKFTRKIQTFLRADPLDYETVLTDLLLNRKSSLVQYLIRNRTDKNYTAFKNRLWESADLLLLDDLYSIRGHQRVSDTKLFDVLCQEPVADGRFQVVKQLLNEEFRPSETLVQQKFKQIGLELESRDLQIVWRSVVLGHKVMKIRSLAALKMSPFSMWQAIAHPNVPIASIHAIGERVAKSENEDPKKIFFDCVRSRIVNAVESFRSRNELSSITKLILLLLDFPFLVETGYFERFDDVLEKFLQRSRQLGLEVEYFENLRERLDSAKRDPDASKANRPPLGITKLPLTIQRRLASEKHYLFWFVTHPDPRIATETLRHIILGNVERILRSPEINVAVMAQLLRKPELFTRSGPLLAALNNPKCDLTFATRHLGTLARSRSGVQALEKISRNPSANPAVRSAATRMVQQQKQRR